MGNKAFLNYEIRLNPQPVPLFTENLLVPRQGRHYTDVNTPATPLPLACATLAGFILSGVR